jgi:peroxiredoxin-like protein
MQGTEKAIEFSTPPEFHGEAGFWTPEHLLLASAASCFVATFRAIAGISKLDFVALEVGVEGMLEKGAGGFEFTKIVLRPVLTIPEPGDRARAERLLEKAEHGCLIARSLKGEVTMEARIESPQNADEVPLLVR